MSRVSVGLLCAVLGWATGATIARADEKPAAVEGFHWIDKPDEGTADLLFGKQPVLRYMYAFDTSTKERQFDTFKVYHHVFGPGSDALITKGPGGLFPHHRGLFLGWNKTGFEGKELDFWHCTKGAHLRHAKFVELSGNDKVGQFEAEIHWNDAEGKPVIIENRHLTVHRLELAGNSTPAWEIDVNTKLASQRGTITLSGDRQHAGLQFRAPQSVADEKSARFIRPAEFPDKPEAIEVGDKENPPLHSNLNWFAETFPVEGKQYTVEYFEDPSLPKPSLYSERPYGRFGAFFKTTLEQDHPLTMRYRLIVSTGEPPKREEIQKRYDEFVAGLKQSDAK
ncbi:MAG TPA: DUF6807 family protein [Planctomycetaceae bacterium]|nr:DUF6807 family protein [Planctomycetaceae bacterium]